MGFPTRWLLPLVAAALAAATTVLPARAAFDEAACPKWVLDYSDLHRQSRGKPGAK
jgi:hypothetical protein